MRNLSGLLFGLIGTVIRILEEWSVAEVTIKRRRCASTSSSSSSSSSGDDVVSLDSDVEGGGGGGENDDDDNHETKPTRPIKSANGMSERMKRNQETEHRIHTVLVALLHAATSVAPYLYSDRAPSAYYCVSFSTCFPLKISEFVQQIYPLFFWILRSYMVVMLFFCTLLNFQGSMSACLYMITTKHAKHPSLSMTTIVVFLLSFMTTFLRLLLAGFNSNAQQTDLCDHAFRAIQPTERLPVNDFHCFVL
ncbi:unnamed protein product [Gongylonema pulchrum]|uniref:Acyl_transf_3 domain-containing protein n=1 Tax=Gongylonema pulchrum TaxID=637853 RepID=A0A183EYE2_9BILA|nr:unnamed protein product [Gongylonema pulchrum]